jgi:hypothetical protein
LSNGNEFKIRFEKGNVFFFRAHFVLILLGPTWMNNALRGIAGYVKNILQKVIITCLNVK